MRSGICTRFGSIVFLVLLCLGPAVLAQEAPSLLRAGTARRDVTPREGVPMWGYGARHDALSTGVLDPLYATALVVEANGTKLAIVGLDLGRSPSEKSLQRIQERIKREAGIEFSLIAGSHTHHGPVLELSDEVGKGKGKFDAALRYYLELETGISDAIIEANRRLTPARLAAGSTSLAAFNRNRHSKLEPKPSDRDLTVVRFDEPSGKPLALLVNFTAHPTMLPASTLKFSADYVGAMRQTVEETTACPVVFMQGASGDISVNEGPNRGYQAFGQALGREVLKVFAGLEGGTVTRPSLVVREERMRFTARVDLANPLIRGMYEKAFFPELIPNFIDEYADGIRPRLTVALLNGEVALVGASGEFFANHAIRIKERARVPHLLFLGYCNGYHQYFPTIEAVAEGGYGADQTVSPVAIGAGEEMMNAALLWLYQMRGKIK